MFKLKVFDVQGVVFRKKIKRGLWIYENREIILKPNDTMYYWLFVFTTDKVRVHKMYSEFTINTYSNGTLYFVENNTRFYT